MLDETGHDTAAERAIIGCLLTTPAAVAMLDVHSNDFLPRHGSIYRAIQRTAEQHTDGSVHMVVAELARADDLQRIGGHLYVAELVEAGCIPAQLDWYAESVRHATVRRTGVAIATRIHQTCTESADLDDVLDTLGEQYTELANLLDGVQRNAAVVVPYDTFEDFCAQPAAAHNWVVPGMLERGERCVITAPEGSGKSTLARQIAACVAAGRHPFDVKLRIPPRRVLLLDEENPPELLRRQLKRMVDPMIENGVDLGGRAYVARDPAGSLDVRTPAGYAGLCRLVEETRAELLCIGPVYKLTQKGSRDSFEDLAVGVQQALQRVAATYGCALFLEHHAGKARDANGQRNLDPYGSSVWLRWSEFGFGLRPDPDGEQNVYLLERFRGDREEGRVGWPSTLIRDLQRGSRPFWRADWDDPEDRMTLAHLCEEALA